MDIAVYIAHLKTVGPRQDEIILAAVRENEAPIVDLNTAQLMKGLDSDGEILGEYRNSEYKRLKQMMNPAAGGHVDLNFTGRFHNSFYLEAERFPFFIRASDLKEPKLTEMYGDNFFGLTKESKAAAREQLKPYIQDRYRAEVFLVR